MKQQSAKIRAFIAVLIASILLFSACKKDQLTVNQEKIFLQVDFKATNSSPYNSGWQVTLKPDGVADIIPSGDIIWRGTYEINGSSLTVKTDNQTYQFRIISETEIKEKNSGVVLRLK